MTRPGLAREAAGVSPPAWKKEKVSQAESRVSVESLPLGRLEWRGRTRVLTDNLAGLEQEAGGGGAPG